MTKQTNKRKDEKNEQTLSRCGVWWILCVPQTNRAGELNQQSTFIIIFFLFGSLHSNNRNMRPDVDILPSIMQPYNFHGCIYSSYDCNLCGNVCHRLGPHRSAPHTRSFSTCSLFVFTVISLVYGMV